MKKNIVIVVLLIVTVLMGTTSYYLYTNKDKINKCDAKCPVPSKGKIEEGTTNNNKINEEKNDKTTIDAAYSWTTENNFTTTVILFKTGKCVVNRSMEYNLCEYEIKDNKLNLHFDADMSHDNPYTVTYDILENNNIKSSNNDELKRMY